MRAWAVVENGKPLQQLELPTPEPKGTEVLVEVTHCGVCHSDLHIWEGFYDLGGGKHMSLKDRGVVLPLAMGHEIVGRVAKLGPDAKGVKVGDLRIVFPWLGFGTRGKGPAGGGKQCSRGSAAAPARSAWRRRITCASCRAASACMRMAATARMSLRRTRATWSIPARSIRPSRRPTRVPASRATRP